MWYVGADAWLTGENTPLGFKVKREQFLGGMRVYCGGATEPA